MQQKFDDTASEKNSIKLSGMSPSEYFNVILKYRRLIVYIVSATFFLSIIVSLMFPKMYVATARILPPQENNNRIVSLLSGADDNPLSGIASSFIGPPPPAALYIGIMKSRSVADALIKKFNLKDLYNKEYIEEVYEKLTERSAINYVKADQIISVSVKDRDPHQAADMANTYVEMLDNINRNLNITQEKRKRLFLEGRLKEVRDDLEKAEIELKSFQEKYNLVAIEEQAKVAIEGAAEISSQIIAAQTELEVLKQIGTEKQIEAVMLKARIEELTKQLVVIEQGERPETKGSSLPNSVKVSNFHIPFDDFPNLGLKLMQLMRERKIQEKLFELITTQYEIARIEEAKDMNTIQILDEAVPPEKKISPKLFSIVISSCLIALLFSTLLCFFLEGSGLFNNNNYKKRFKFFK